MADVEFYDYSMKVKAALNSRINAVLHECAGEMVSRTKRNSRVDTGQTKNSFQYKVVPTNEGFDAYIGSNHENAIWEEFGTGEHALAGNGRKGGWSYKDAKGKWHHTTGKKPSRAFWKAYTALRSKIISRIRNSLKEL